MRWLVFLFFAFVSLLLDTTVLRALRLDLGAVVNIAPSFSPCLAVFICLFAPRLTALWACWALGLLLDLRTGSGTPPVHVIGPQALGFVLGGLLVLQLRGMVFRRRALTIAVLTVAVMVLIHLVSVTAFVVRSWWPQLAVHWTEVGPGFELMRRLSISVYSGLIALPLGWLLLAGYGVWGFHMPGQRGGWR